MSIVDMVLLGVIIAAVIGAVVWIVRRKRSGKGCCGCESCAYKGICHK